MLIYSTRSRENVSSQRMKKSGPSSPPLGIQKRLFRARNSGGLLNRTQRNRVLVHHFADTSDLPRLGADAFFNLQPERSD